ncbi:hypothetical protein PCE1_001286 [Barthelona sp. PCE]
MSFWSGKEGPVNIKKKVVKINSPKPIRRQKPQFSPQKQKESAYNRFTKIDTPNMDRMRPGRAHTSMGFYSQNVPNTKPLALPLDEFDSMFANDLDNVLAMMSARTSDSRRSVECVEDTFDENGLPTNISGLADVDTALSPLNDIPVPHTPFSVDSSETPPLTESPLEPVLPPQTPSYFQLSAKAKPRTKSKQFTIIPRAYYVERTIPQFVDSKEHHVYFDDVRKQWKEVMWPKLSPSIEDVQYLVNCMGQMRAAKTRPASETCLGVEYHPETDKDLLSRFDEEGAIYRMIAAELCRTLQESEDNNLFRCGDLVNVISNSLTELMSVCVRFFEKSRRHYAHKFTNLEGELTKAVTKDDTLYDELKAALHSVQETVESSKPSDMVDMIKKYKKKVKDLEFDITSQNDTIVRLSGQIDRLKAENKELRQTISPKTEDIQMSRSYTKTYVEVAVGDEVPYQMKTFASLNMEMPHFDDEDDPMKEIDRETSKSKPQLVSRKSKGNIKRTASNTSVLSFREEEEEEEIPASVRGMRSVKELQEEDARLSARSHHTQNSARSMYEHQSLSELEHVPELDIIPDDNYEWEELETSSEELSDGEVEVDEGAVGEDQRLREKEKRKWLTDNDLREEFHQTLMRVEEARQTALEEHKRNEDVRLSRKRKAELLSLFATNVNLKTITPFEDEVVTDLTVKLMRQIVFFYIPFNGLFERADVFRSDNMMLGIRSISKIIYSIFFTSYETIRASETALAAYFLGLTKSKVFFNRDFLSILDGTFSCDFVLFYLNAFFIIDSDSGSFMDKKKTYVSSLKAESVVQQLFISQPMDIVSSYINSLRRLYTGTTVSFGGIDVSKIKMDSMLHFLMKCYSKAKTDCLRTLKRNWVLSSEYFKNDVETINPSKVMLDLDDFRIFVRSVLFASDLQILDWFVDCCHISCETMEVGHSGEEERETSSDSRNAIFFQTFLKSECFFPLLFRVLQIPFSFISNENATFGLPSATIDIKFGLLKNYWNQLEKQATFVFNVFARKSKKINSLYPVYDMLRFNLNSMLSSYTNLEQCIVLFRKVCFFFEFASESFDASILAATESDFTANIQQLGGMVERVVDRQVTVELEKFLDKFVDEYLEDVILMVVDDLITVTD